MELESAAFFDSSSSFEWRHRQMKTEVSGSGRSRESESAAADPLLVDLSRVAGQECASSPCVIRELASEDDFCTEVRV